VVFITIITASTGRLAMNKEFEKIKKEIEIFKGFTSHSN